MGDFYIICRTKEDAKGILETITSYTTSVGLTLNRKTQIVPFKNGLNFLGFHSYITHGELVVKLSNQNKRNAQRKYLKMAKAVSTGKIERSKFYESYAAWKNHASQGTCSGLILSLDNRINKILPKEGDIDESKQEKTA